MDKELIKRRFERAMNGYSAHADVQRRMAERLVWMLSDIRNFSKVLEIGCGDALLTRMFVKKFSPERMIVNDLCPSAKKFVSELPVAEFVPGDAEQIDFEGRYDLIISGASVQWFNDLPVFFDKCEGLLEPGGILAFSTFGPDNLKEFSTLEDVGLKYYDADELENMLSEHFTKVSVTQEYIVMTFASAAEVLRHLKSTGVTGIRREAWTKEKYLRFIRCYEELFGCSSGVSLTYHPIFVLAEK